MPDVNAFLNFYDVQSPKRAFYSSGQKDDYLGYVDTGIQSTKELDYLDYAGNEMKSSGLFNANGAITKAEKKRLREKLRKAESCIWDLVISFATEYGEKNMTNADQAQKLLSKVLPKFFKNAGLHPENIVWYAGLHTNTDNRHIHISFFENEPMWFHRKTKTYRYRQKGMLNQTAINTLKMDVERYFMQPVESVKRVRKLLTDESKATVALSGSFALKRLIRELYEEIPYTGRTAYESESMDSCRGTVNAIVTHILTNGENKIEYENLSNDLAKRDTEMRKLCKEHKIENAEPYLYTDKFQRDLYRRMGNAVIKEVLKKRREELIRARELRHVKARQNHHTKSLVDCVLKSAEIAAYADEETVRCFEEYRERLEQIEIERKIKEMEM